MPIDWDSVPVRRSEPFAKLRARALAAQAPETAPAPLAAPAWGGGEARDLRTPIHPEIYERALRDVNRDRRSMGVPPLGHLPEVRPWGDPARRAPMAGGKDPGHIIRDPDRLLAVMRNDPKTFEPEVDPVVVSRRERVKNRRRRPRLMKGGK